MCRSCFGVRSRSYESVVFRRGLVSSLECVLESLSGVGWTQMSSSFVDCADDAGVVDIAG